MAEFLPVKRSDTHQRVRKLVDGAWKIVRAMTAAVACCCTPTTPPPPPPCDDVAGPCPSGGPDSYLMTASGIDVLSPGCYPDDSGIERSIKWLDPNTSDAVNGTWCLIPFTTSDPGSCGWAYNTGDPPPTDFWEVHANLSCTDLALTRSGGYIRSLSISGNLDGTIHFAVVIEVGGAAVFDGAADVPNDDPRGPLYHNVTIPNSLTGGVSFHQFGSGGSVTLVPCCL